MTYLEYIQQSSDIPDDAKKDISRNEVHFSYILVTYKKYLEELRSLERKKLTKQISNADFFERYEILRLGFASTVSLTLENFVKELGEEKAAGGKNE